MKDWKNICEFEDMKPINKSLLETGRNKKVSSEMKGLEKLEKNLYIPESECFLVKTTSFDFELENEMLLREHDVNDGTDEDE